MHGLVIVYWMLLLIHVYNVVRSSWCILVCMSKVYADILKGPLFK